MNVWKDWTGVASRSGGTATQCAAAPQSMPATFGLMRSRTVGETRGLPGDRRRLCFIGRSSILARSIREQGDGMESILPNGILRV